MEMEPWTNARGPRPRGSFRSGCGPREGQRLVATVLGAGPAVGSWTGLMQMGEEKTNSEGHFRGTGGSITQGSESECECECECVGEALRMGEGGVAVSGLFEGEGLSVLQGGPTGV